MDEKENLFDSDTSNEYESRMKKALPGYDDLYEMTSSFLLMGIPEKGNILIVGAGGGKEIDHLTNANQNWKLTGVDPSAEMLEIAKKKTKTNGYNVDLHHGFIDTLPKETQYDGATSMLVLHFINSDSEKLAFLKNISSRLKKGATFVLASVSGEKGSEDFLYFEKSWKIFMARNGIDHDENEERNKKFADLVFPITEKRTEKLLTDAGFSDVKGFYRGFSFSGWVAKKA